MGGLLVRSDDLEIKSGGQEIARSNNQGGQHRRLREVTFLWKPMRQQVKVIKDGGRHNKRENFLRSFSKKCTWKAAGDYDRAERNNCLKKMPTVTCRTRRKFKLSEMVKVFYSGKELEDDKSLTIQEICPNFVLHLVHAKIQLRPKAPRLPAEIKPLLTSHFAGEDIYGGSDRLLSQVVPRKVIVVKRVDTSDLHEVASAIGPMTKLESMATNNPPVEGEGLGCLAYSPLSMPWCLGDKCFRPSWNTGAKVASNTVLSGTRPNVTVRTCIDYGRLHAMSELIQFMNTDIDLDESIAQITPTHLDNITAQDVSMDNTSALDDTPLNFSLLLLLTTNFMLKGAPSKPYADALVLSLFGEPTSAERRVSWQDKLKRDELDSEL
ncbi:hypothetical protein KSP40_PGU012067 [Platanthera guangdongensis]|uniref:Ubiquitin-like domain-containing protein n=1 Tax=Platanthera guangdongensis TaxID=2320717 RepID=A0ABR2MCM0_9ASPA